MHVRVYVCIRVSMSVRQSGVEDDSTCDWHVCVCVRERQRGCVCEGMCMCVCVCMCVGMCMCVCVCMYMCVQGLDDEDDFV